MLLTFPNVERLKQRLRRMQDHVARVDWRRFEIEVNYFLNTLNEIPEFHALFEKLDALATEPAVAERLQELKSVGQYPRTMCLPPNTPDLRAAWQFGVLTELANAEHGSQSIILACVGMHDDKPATIRAFQSQVLDVFCDYLEDHLAETDFLLGLLWRYRRLVEWFRHADLAAKYAGDGWPEDGLHADLARYLMEQGIAYPFSKPAAPEAQPDIIVPPLLPYEKTATPLPIEVKVCRADDAANRAEVRKGFGQALDYAQKYASPFGYLVVFNATGEGRLQFGASDGDVVPQVRFQNKVIYCVGVQVASLGRPSDRATPGQRTIVLSEDYLTNVNISR